MGRAQLLLTGEKIPIEERRPRKDSERKRIDRGTGGSGEETLYEEAERIAEYIEEDFRKTIYNMPTAQIGLSSLMRDPNFRNLFKDVSRKGRKDFMQYLIDSNASHNLERIESRKIKTKTGIKRSGEFVDKESNYYAIVVDIMGRKQVQFRNYETGRLVSYREITESLSS